MFVKALQEFLQSKLLYMYHTKIIICTIPKLYIFKKNINQSLLIFNDNRTVHFWIYPNGQCINSLDHKNTLHNSIISMYFEISDLWYSIFV